ncbi:MAG: hypothetical protein RL387_95 [Bacteroidota bacterium]|jgi:hypothetical protein
MKKVLFALVVILSSCTKTETSDPAPPSVVVTPTTPTTPTVPTIAPDTVLAAKINQAPVFQFQGFNYGLWGKDWGSTKFPNSKLIDYIQDCGSNTIIFDWAVNYNDDGTLIPIESNANYHPPIDDIKRLVKWTKDRGFFVILKPHAAGQTSMGNRNIWSTDTTKFNQKFLGEWSKYLTTLIKSVGTTSFDGICIGTEMNHIDDRRRDEWVSLIDNVRTIFKGQVTYDGLFNRWGSVPDINEVVFWDKVDFIGVSLYVSVSKDDNATEDQIVNGWYSNYDYNQNELGDIGNVVNYLKNLSVKYNKKIYAMESGYQSASSALFNTNDSPGTTKSVNNDLQKRGISGYFRVLNANPTLFAGTSIWGISSLVLEQIKNNDIWYTQEFPTYGKPATDVIKLNYKK